MPRFWMLALLGLSACSSLNIEIIRSPASMGSCNRQTLGSNSSENLALVEYNTKRRDVASQLLQAQIARLQARGSNHSMQTRIRSLQERLNSLSVTEMRAWDEPNEVSYKIHRALESYLDDVALDEKAKLLADKDLQSIKYVRESIEPNVSQLSYWIPEFCKTASGQSSSEMFNGL